MAGCRPVASQAVMPASEDSVLAIRCIASLHPTRIAIARGPHLNLHRTCAFTGPRGWWATAMPFPLGQLPRIPLGAGTWAGVLA